VQTTKGSARAKGAGGQGGKAPLHKSQKFEALLTSNVQPEAADGAPAKPSKIAAGLGGGFRGSQV